MIAIPPYILLIPFGAFLLFFLFFALANVFSMAKYGGGNWIGYLSTLFFLSASAIVIFLTWQALPAIDWQTPVPLVQTAVTPF